MWMGEFKKSVWLTGLMQHLSWKHEFVVSRVSWAKTDKTHTTPQITTKKNSSVLIHELCVCFYLAKFYWTVLNILNILVISD